MILKILSYNIHKGFSPSGLNYQIDQLKKMIHNTHADIVFLQEVIGLSQKYNIQNQFEILADVVWTHYSYGKNAIFDGHNHGNAILSKFPILEFDNFNLSQYFLEQRGLQYCHIEVPQKNKTLKLFNTHLDLFQFNRNKQLKIINSILQEKTKPHDQIMLCGDFNDWNKKLHKTITQDMHFHDAFEEVNKKLATTFPSPLPALSLDRIYLKNINAQSAITLNELHSDHLAILTEVKI